MWTRSLLKNNAKGALTGRYWRSFLLCVLLGLVGVGAVVPKVTAQFNYNYERLSSIGKPEVWAGNGTGGDIFWGEISPYAGTVACIMLIMILIGIIFGLCWAFFLLLPLEVGRNRYFMESRQAATPLRSVLTVFRTPYLNMVKTLALTSLKIMLGYILVIPGIYWSYCYRQVKYLMAENPYMTASRAMELSRQMMDGEKWNTFVLDISFIGWMLLCALSFGIGYLFLEPYIQATYAELYAALRSKAMANGMTDSTELGGFVRHADGSQLF